VTKLYLSTVKSELSKNFSSRVTRTVLNELPCESQLRSLTFDLRIKVAKMSRVTWKSVISPICLMTPAGHQLFFHTQVTMAMGVGRIFSKGGQKWWTLFFSHSELRKPFFAKNFKIQGGQSPSFRRPWPYIPPYSSTKFVWISTELLEITIPKIIYWGNWGWKSAFTYFDNLVKKWYSLLGLQIPEQWHHTLF